MFKCCFDIQIANCLISSSRYNVSLVAPIFENVGMGKICLQGWCGRDRLMGSSRRQEWHAPWLSCSWHHHWSCHLPCHKVQLLCFACSLALLGFLHWDDCKTVECMCSHLRNEFFFLVRKESQHSSSAVDAAAAADDGMCSTHSWLVKWLRCCCCCCSTWVMMNQDTRRLSKMPKEVLDEISPYFLDRSVMKDNDGCQRIKKLTDTAPYIRSDLVVSPNHWFHNAMQFWTMLDGWSQLSTNALFLCGGAVHFLHNIWYMMIWELSVISHKCMDLFLGCCFCSHVWMIWIWTSMWIM